MDNPKKPQRKSLRIKLGNNSITIKRQAGMAGKTLNDYMLLLIQKGLNAYRRERARNIADRELRQEAK